MATDTQRKVRPDAKLKLLPAEVRRVLFEALNGGMSYAEAVPWCAEGIEVDGETHRLQTSKTALGAFFEWQAAANAVEEREDRRRLYMDKVKEVYPEISIAELERAGDMHFMLGTLADDNVAGWVRIQRLRGAREKFTEEKRQWEAEHALDLRRLEQKSQALEQAERKLAMLEAKFAEAEKALNNPGTSLEEREARLREIFGTA